MNPMLLGRAFGLTNPVGMGLNIASMYPLVKDDASSAASRHARGEALRQTYRDSFNSDRTRQGLPPVWLGPPNAQSMLSPQAPAQPATQGAPATSLPPLPPAVNIPSMPVAPASMQNPQSPPGAPMNILPPAAQDAYGMGQPASGPSLIQKFMAQLHAAGPGVQPDDRHALKGW